MRNTLPKERRYKPAERGDVMEYICSLIATDTRSLRAICADPAYAVPISPSTFWRWLPEDRAFCDLYARAKQWQAEILADEIIAIADDSRRDFVNRVLVDGTVKRVFDPTNVQRSRLRINARKWTLSKLLPKKYGPHRRQLEACRKSPW